MHSSEISQEFLKFHQNKGFSVLPGASLLDPSIPMTFVMSAGLVQVETVLNHRERSWSGKEYVLLQKCFRHFDITTVGTTDMHLSLFEMPAAFSFGPVREIDSIHRMWELLTSTFGFPEENLWVTYFAGDEIFGHTFEIDSEVCYAWREVGLPEERVIGFGANANFWKQGDGISGQGRYHKCGSNTEVFFDRGSYLSCGSGCRPGCHCGRFIEIANLDFVGAEIDKQTNILRPIANPFTELVIGAERMAMILQQRKSIFDIDSIASIKRTVRKFSKTNGIPSKMVSESENILVDHWRAIIALVADGAPPPGKAGRQRIMKILIRGILARQMILGVDPNYLSSITDAMIAGCLESQNPIKIQDTVLSYLKIESERFMQTLDKGRRQFQKLLTNNGNSLTGEEVVHLEKQWGVPSTIVELWLLERELYFDNSAYEDALRGWRSSIKTRSKQLEKEGRYHAIES